MKLSEMRRWLEERDIQLTKSLGQNFLHDQNQLDRIVAHSGLADGNRILEIGPGLGPLTARLLERAAEVFAIEMDGRLAAILHERFADQPHLRLEQADALQWIRRNPRDWSGWKLIANLPYSVASPLLVELARQSGGPDSMTVTLQAEVVDRINARPATADYGVLTLLIGLRYRPAGSFRIPAGCFFPEPAVQSACVHLVRRTDSPLPPSLETAFDRLVKLGFSQRRKMMLKLLKQHWPAETLATAFTTLGLDEKIRAEAVVLEQFARLTRILAGGETASKS